MDTRTKHAIDQTAALIAELCTTAVLEAVEARATWSALPDGKRAGFTAALSAEVAALVARVVLQASKAGRGGDRGGNAGSWVP